MKITPHQRAELRSHSVYLTRRQRHCAWQRTRFVRSLIGCTIMLAAPHVLRQRARRPQRPRSNCPAAVVVSLPTSGSAPQPGRMSNRVDISALWRMYYRWHRLRLRDARVRERRRHVLRPRHIPRARACVGGWSWPSHVLFLPGARNTLSDMQSAVAMAAHRRAAADVAATELADQRRILAREVRSAHARVCEARGLSSTFATRAESTASCHMRDKAEVRRRASRRRFAQQAPAAR
mmetsp:Transcript_6224/g.19620  ORF Transcript_6224/g.19620 Transcript_6224/m.19620 type:complete len:236 (+) Transcript_6224:783-1490(+)